MARVTARDVVIATACTALGLVPFLARLPGFAYCVAAATLLAGVLLGVRGVVLVVAVCLGLAAAELVLVQLDPGGAPYDNGGDARAVLAYYLATVFAGALACVAAAGALGRWVALRTRRQGRD
jgi:hypothetical protein